MIENLFVFKIDDKEGKKEWYSKRVVTLYTNGLIYVLIELYNNNTVYYYLIPVQNLSFILLQCIIGFFIRL